MAHTGRAGKSDQKLAVALRGLYIKIPFGAMPPGSHKTYVTKRGKLYNGYLRCKVEGHPFISDGWLLEHWYVLSHYHGTQLKNPIQGVRCCIHHYDGNIENNSLKNLRLLPFAEHQRHHVTGLTRSEETRQKMSAWQKGKRVMSEESKRKLSETRKRKFGG